jgi:glycosyltransferase involved in cell wall biosynthesis
MRVLVLTNMYPSPAKPWFGIFVHEQVQELERLGVDVTVLPFDGTEVRSNYLRAAVRFRRLLRTDRFDLVHAHYGLTGAIAIAQRRVPVVTTFHGGDFSGLVPWHAAVSRFVARRCTPIVVTAEGRERLAVPDATILPAGVDTTRFRPLDRLSARAELGLDPARPYALLLGARSDANKRADLFDAAVSEARAVIPELGALALEGLDRDRVVVTMNAVDVGVLTSDREGLPVAVRETLACQTPVVAVPAGGVPGILQGLAGCAIVPRDPRDIGAAIVAAIRSKRPAALRARAEETSGAAIAAQLVALYTEVLKQRAPLPRVLDGTS